MDAAGEPVSKNVSKTLKKAYDAQKKLYDKYIASQSGAVPSSSNNNNEEVEEES
jgi:hypothetical protein